MKRSDNSRTLFLREETITSRNKIARRAMPSEWSAANLPYGFCERKACATNLIFDNMPLFIGPKELIVGTRTLFAAVEGNEDNHSVFDYSPWAHPGYINQEDIDFFGFNEEFSNKTHFTPDYSIVLEKGIGGIVSQAQEKLKDTSLNDYNRDFLKAVIRIYQGFSRLIKRYADYAEELSTAETDQNRKVELCKIAQVCRNISEKPANDFYEAVQLFWFAQTAAIIENRMFVNYGRADVILGRYLRDYPREEAQQLIECLLLKMYDQVDLNYDYTHKYSAQLNVTLGGVDENGEDAVNEVTMMFLDGVALTRLPEPELSLRINSKNPDEFLSKAAQLSIQGINCFAYYNDDLFIESMIGAGVKPEYARCYGFDLCQDINIPGIGDWYLAALVSLAEVVLEALKNSRDDMIWEEFLDDVKERMAKEWKRRIGGFNICLNGVQKFAAGDIKGYIEGVKNKEFGPSYSCQSPMSPLPFLSALYYGCVDQGLDVNLNRPLLDHHKGSFVMSPVEGVNSLAALRKCCFDQKEYKLSEVWAACENDYGTPEQEIMRQKLLNAPKWGNDDDYVDLIAKDVLEHSLREIMKYETIDGARHLAGIHQPHPVLTGWGLMATPDGRKKGKPVAVSLTAASGTMKNGATAALKSAAKIDYKLCQWNFCVMVSYFSTVFQGENGPKLFIKLLKSYFELGGLQHQPNVLDIEALKAAKKEPEKYKDLIVRLWGVSAHFVDLPEEQQDEMIARLG